MRSGTAERRRRVGVAAGTAAPLLFLAIAFALAVLRHDVIAAQGWVSWPSSMGIGGWPGAGQIIAFLILSAAYPVFAWWALHPAIGRGHLALTAVAIGELFLAFPTDARGAGTSWHGALHLTGVFIVTAATALTAAIITAATWSHPGWRWWRLVGMPSVAAGVVVGAVEGFDYAWAKIFFVCAVTLPIALLAQLVALEDPA